MSKALTIFPAAPTLILSRILEIPPQPPDNGIVAPHRMERLEKIIDASDRQDSALSQSGSASLRVSGAEGR